MHLFTQSAVLQALGWTLFNSLWQMAALWVLYVAGIKIFKNHSAHARHGWALLLLGAGATWSGISFIAALFTGSAPVPFFVDWPAAGTGLAGIGYGYHLVGKLRQWMSEGLPYGSLLYLIVLVFLFVRYFNHYLHSRRIKITGLSEIQPEWKVFVERMSFLMGIGKKVSVAFSALVDGPVTLGFLKPVILIPVATMNNLSLQQVEAILVHELAHIKRNDYLLNLGVTVIDILFFFNPFSRLLIRDIKAEREHRCDDQVLQFQYDSHTYISALLSLATGGSRPKQQLALAAAGGNDQLLLQRVRRILRHKGRTGRPDTRIFFFLLFALAAAGLALSRTARPVARMNPIPPAVAVINIRMVGPEGLPGFVPATARIVVRSSVVVREIKHHPGIPPVPPARLKIEAPPAPPPLLHTIVLAGDDETPFGEEVVNLVQPKAREYSIGADNTGAKSAPGRSVTILRTQPYVPGSSFSFHYQMDSTHPEEQLAYLQATAIREMDQAIWKMQELLLAKLKELQIASAQTRDPALAKKLQKQLQEQQVQWRRELQKKQQELENRLKRLGSRLTIVYI